MTTAQMAELSGFNRVYVDNLIKNLNRKSDLERIAIREAATRELENFHEYHSA